MIYVLNDFGDFVIKGKLDSQGWSFCIYIYILFFGNIHLYLLGTWEHGLFLLGTWEQTPLFYGNMGT